MTLCILSAVFFFCIALALARTGSAATDQFYRISKEQWEKEYTKGEWAYLDRQAIERARAGVIVNMFYDMYGGGAFGSVYASGISSTGSAGNEPPILNILDVGCGPGTLSDYLRGHQRRVYEGIDLSLEAVNTARKLRADLSVSHLIHAGVRPLRPEQFQQADCMEWEPPKDKQGNPRTYGTIVFNEMLYYVDHKKVLERFQRFLAPDGIFVISVWFNKEKSLRDTIFADARRMMQSVDEVEFTGVTYTGVKRVRMPVSFHVEAFRPKRAVASV